MARIDGIDDRFEALLAERLRERNRDGRDQCPEVALIAAYSERSLPLSEREGVEHHLAGCARCRAELTAIARAAREPEAARAAEPRLKRWWSSTTVGLAVAGSIAVVVAIGLGRDYYHQESSPPAVRMAANSAAAGSSQAPRLAAKRLVPQVQLEAGARAAAPLARPPQAALSREIGGAAARPQAQAMLGAAGAIPGAAIGGTAASSAEQQSPTFARPGWAYGSTTSPDGSVRWEFGRRGTIERFVANAMMTAQVPGVTSDLLAGSAPTSSICWVVGRGGTVLRTIDGVHWSKINSPTSADLVSVSAQSADAVTVTDRDSRRYATIDGGQSWQTP